jgi:hypothetical protein
VNYDTGADDDDDEEEEESDEEESPIANNLNKANATVKATAEEAWQAERLLASVNIGSNTLLVALPLLMSVFH